MTAASPVIRRSEVPNIHGQRLFNPFPGLRPFGPEEADLFFGRETHIEELLKRLATSRFVAVVGTSGSGKSSLVMAGALPRLDGGFRTPFGRFWRVAQMRPGDDPIGNLAAALVPTDDVKKESNSENTEALDDTGIIRLALTEAGLNRSTMGLIRATREIGLEKHQNLLVVVDQFEEVFRFRELRQKSHRDTATAFVNLLLTATQQTDIPIYVLITMRSDFLGECVQFRGLAEAINQGQYLIPLLNRRQRQMAIEGPIGVAGASIDPPLLQRLLNDASRMTDQLPVLQHALMRSFDIWLSGLNTERPIALADYEEAGGTASALSRHADEACRELENEELRVAKVLFRCLADRSRDGRWVRRPCRLEEILAVAETDMRTLERVIDTFTAHARSFLVLQPESGDLTPETVVDLSHESLMRLWKQMQAWSEEEMRASEQLQRLHDAAVRYEQDKGGLWSDPELALALKWQEEWQPNQVWAGRYAVDYNRVKTFIRKSREVRDMRAAELERDRTERLKQAEALAEAEQKKAEAIRHKAEAEMAKRDAEEEKNKAIQLRRQSQQQKVLIVLVVLLAIAALAVAGFAYRQKIYADEAKNLSEKMRADAEKANESLKMANENAEEQRRIAEEEKAAAEAQKTIAFRALNDAKRQKKRAEKQKEAANIEKNRAEEEKLKADRARQIALMEQKRARAAMEAAEKEKEKAIKAELRAKIERHRAAKALRAKERLERKEKEIKDATETIPEWN